MVNKFGIDEQMSDIGALIKRENREEERQVLMILHGLTNIIATLTARIEEIEAIARTQNELLLAQQKIIDNGQITWKIILAIFSASSLTVLGLFGYGYNLIANMHDEMVAQQTINEYVDKQQLLKSNENKNNIVDTQIDTKNNANDLESLQNEIARLQKLKSIKASK